VDESNPQPPTTSEFQLSASPSGLFPVGDGMGVADTLNNRILVFLPIEQWSPGQTFQAANELFGQSDFSGSSANQGNPSASATSLQDPSDAFFFNNQLFIADTRNNRVLVVPQSGVTLGSATAVLGQDLMTLNAPNLVEGRELNLVSASGTLGDAGLAVDLSSNPPHLYIADTYNNRILGYKDLRNLQPGQKADIVIGQPDFQQILANYPTNNANQPTATGLSHPTGVVVDSNGNVLVADSGNGRVLRFPAPFAHFTAGTAEQADLVLGQQNFTSTIPDPTERTMGAPYGLAFASTHGLLVSDIAQNRVLFFPEDNNGGFTSGEAATLVFGQPNFTSATAGSAANQLNSPRHIATDTDDRLYVADTLNGRVQIFDHAPTSAPNPSAAYTLTAGLSRPAGIYVSASTGEVWVADASNGQSYRFANFNQLVIGSNTPNLTLGDSVSPRAVTEDAWGNLFIADTGNRVIIFYPGLAALNAANYLNQNVLAPGLITAVFSQGNTGQFGAASAQAGSLPLPTTLNGVQVLFNGAPAPLFYAGPNQINFMVPIGAPQSGLADVQVMEASTGRLLGDTTVGMNIVAPGIFTQAANGIGAAAALNQDNTLNSQTNPAVQGSVIQIFATGQGYIPGAPADGAASTALSTPVRPFVIVGIERVPDSAVQYSGLAPGLVGVWQVNVQIPLDVITTPTNPTQVILDLNSVPSGGGGLGRPVLIYVKQRQ
jgi:uncharacterized protein (TIGR03437 family)